MMVKARKPMHMKVVAERAPEDAAVSKLVSRLEAEADREIASGAVTLRWGKEQLAVVKRAAAILGVPYQTYLKQVVFRQALADIEQAAAVLTEESQPKDSGRQGHRARRSKAVTPSSTAGGPG